MLRNQMPAPEFRLRDASGGEQSLTELRGDGALLCYFFRFAGCPTAQRDLMAYADVARRVKALGAGLVAISADSPERHREMRERLRLPFPLLSDEGFGVSEQYGVYRSDDGEGPEPHGEPAVFILDVDGKIAYSQVQSGPKGSADPAEMALVLFYMAQNDGRYI